MRQLISCAFILVFVLSFLFSTAFAEKEVTVKRVEDLVPGIVTMGETAIGDACVVGNTAPSAFALSNFILPPEEYKLAFRPLVGGDCAGVCQVPGSGWGFSVNTISIYLQTDAACTIIMSVNLEAATYPTSSDCIEPGPVYCESALFQVDLPSAGGWKISLPIDCPCLGIKKEYLLSWYIDSTTCPNIDLVTDAGPATLCTNWNNYGSGWTDLLVAYPTWPGNLRLVADAECCDLPVPVEERNWGVIKNLYKE